MRTRNEPPRITRAARMMMAKNPMPSWLAKATKFSPPFDTGAGPVTAPGEPVPPVGALPAPLAGNEGEGADIATPLEVPVDPELIGLLAEAGDVPTVGVLVEGDGPTPVSEPGGVAGPGREAVCTAATARPHVCV